jgi:glucose-1-phosphate cytidylyltransferase
MKAVILAGGFGSRISEESHLKPKPMIEIGGKPILWHILKSYSVHGINDFIICCGYKGYVIKEYFSNYFLHMADVTLNLKQNSMLVLHEEVESWRITLVNTGENTSTGGRLKRVEKYLVDEKAFCFNYGDGLSDINIAKEIEFHFEHGKMATVASVKQPSRYGALEIVGNQVVKFDEKPIGKSGMVSGGFFVLSPEVFRYLENDQTCWEHGPLVALADSGQLMAFNHEGFWQSMDTLRDRNLLEDLWQKDMAPWKLWK